MTSPFAGPLHAFLAGSGCDHRGRRISDILAYSDRQLEDSHDYIQWLFPLQAPSRAQPGSPVLNDREADAVRGDPGALSNLLHARDRMTRFYESTDHWLVRLDHNHLRITRIIGSLRLLAGEEAAHAFFRAVTARHAAAGSPVNEESLRFWKDALHPAR